MDHNASESEPHMQDNAPNPGDERAMHLPAEQRPFGPAGFTPPQTPSVTPPSGEVGGPRFGSSTGGPRGSAVFGWTCVVLGCLLMWAMHRFGGSAIQSEPGATDAGVIVMELQGKMLLGAKELPGGQGMIIYGQTKAQLNLGSVAQRQRFAVLAAELAGPEEASGIVAHIDELVADATAEHLHRSREELSSPRSDVPDAPIVDGSLERADDHLPDAVRAGVVTQGQFEVQNILRSMYDVGDGGWPAAHTNIEAITPKQRQVLLSELGWFGKLALAPPDDPNAGDRQRLVESSFIGLAIIMGLLVVLGLLGIAGLGGLIILLTFAFTGRVRSGLGRGCVHHGLYAETFGIWLLLFPLMQLGVAFAGKVWPRLEMPILLAVFFGSLCVLVWPVLRGARWRDVRADIGWTFGSRPVLTPVFGLMGYAMGLPMLMVGFACTFGLMLLQGVFAPPMSPLEPAGGPAHPIVMELGGPDIWPKLMLLALGAVAAPIVEETMFRGVLYRHLRGASRRFGVALSIILSAFVSGFIFAAIHPQGWVAIPALMSLSFAFVLVREWRGTLIPSMFVHGISNFIVMSLLIIILSV